MCEEFHVLLSAESFVPLKGENFLAGSLFFIFVELLVLGKRLTDHGRAGNSSVLNIVNTAKENTSWARAGNENMVISTEDLQFLLECRRKMGREK